MAKARVRFRLRSMKVKYRAKTQEIRDFKMENYKIKKHLKLCLATQDTDIFQ